MIISCLVRSRDVPEDSSSSGEEPPPPPSSFLPAQSEAGLQTGGGTQSMRRHRGIQVREMKQQIPAVIVDKLSCPGGSGWPRLRSCAANQKSWGEPNQQMGVMRTAQRRISLQGVSQGRTSKYVRMLSLNLACNGTTLFVHSEVLRRNSKIEQRPRVIISIKSLVRLSDEVRIFI